jgi:hypothetical protein
MDPGLTPHRPGGQGQASCARTRIIRVPHRGSGRADSCVPSGREKEGEERREIERESECWPCVAAPPRAPAAGRGPLFASSAPRPPTPGYSAVRVPDLKVPIGWFLFHLTCEDEDSKLRAVTHRETLSSVPSNWQQRRRSRAKLRLGAGSGEN